MFSEMIPCNAIEFKAVPATERSFSKEFAKNLAQSIEIEGQHQPIVVRPNPDKPGHYLGVIGRHRHYAVSKCLRRDVIEAKVIHDMDESDADMARTAENLWRNPLKKAQHLLAIQKWHEYYTAKYPHKIGSGSPRAAGKDVLQKASQQGPELGKPTVGFPSSDQEASDLDDKSGHDETKDDDAPTFPKLVSQTTGESLSSAKVTTKIAKTFTADQIEVFDQMGVGKVDMHSVAKIKDEQHRAEVINLIASGMDPKEAIAAVLKPEDGTIKLGNGRTVDVDSKHEAVAKRSNWSSKVNPRRRSPACLTEGAPLWIPDFSSRKNQGSTLPSLRRNTPASSSAGW